MSGVDVTNFTGQTYQNTTSPFNITWNKFRINFGNVISTQNYTYEEIDGDVETMLSGGIPMSNTGVGGSILLEIWILILHLQMLDLFKQLFRAKNTAGNGTYVHNDTKVQVHTASQSGVSELAISFRLIR